MTDLVVIPDEDEQQVDDEDVDMAGEETEVNNGNGEEDGDGANDELTQQPVEASRRITFLE